MIKIMYVSLLFLLFPLNIFGRDALKHFIKYKKVKRTEIKMLNQNTDNSKYWVEYKYTFEFNKKVEEKIIKLNVGLALNNQNKFDCNVLNKNNVTIYQGYSIDVINSIQKYLNLSIEYFILENSQNTTDYLSSSLIDIILCHPTLKKNNLNVATLHSTLKSKHVIIYKPAKFNFIKDIFIITFAGSLWLAFLAVLIILAVCLRISTKKYSSLHPQYESWTWVEITLWSIAAACQQGLSHTPYGFSSCCIFLMGYLMAYLLYTGFAAAITSVLLQYEIYYNIDVSNIHSNKLKLICFEDSQEYARELNNKFIKTIYTNDLTKIFKFLDHDNTLALAPEIITNQYLANNFDNSEVDEYKIYKLNYFKYERGFYLKQNDTKLKKLLNRQLQKMEEKGILKNMLNRHLKPVLSSNINYGYSSAGLEHVGSALLILLGGLLASIMFLCAEYSVAFYKRNPQLFQPALK